MGRLIWLDYVGIAIHACISFFGVLLNGFIFLVLFGDTHRKLLDAFQMQLAFFDCIESLVGPICVIAFRIVILESLTTGLQILLSSFFMALINITMEDLMTNLIAIIRMINVIIFGVYLQGTSVSKLISVRSLRCM